jgi:hypothetical protein
VIPSDPAAPPAPPLPVGAVVTGIVVFAVVSWIVIAARLKLPSYGAALLVFWYWTSLGRTDPRTLPAALIGGLAGIGIIFALKALLTLGVIGIGLGVLMFAVAILVDIMRWAPWAVNSCALLFTTVIGVPAIMNGTDFRELVATFALGSGYLALISFAAMRFAPRPEV